MSISMYAVSYKLVPTLDQDHWWKCFKSVLNYGHFVRGWMVYRGFAYNTRTAQLYWRTV